jgi:hypothetical protein
MRHAEATQEAQATVRSDTPIGYTEGSGKMSSTRATRKSIRDIPGYTISADGIARKWNRKLDIHKGPRDLPVIDVNGVKHLLDEVVARAFLGPPPCDLRGVTVVHFDNDPLNCAVDNIAWRIDREWLESRVERQVQARMRPAYRRPTKQRIHFFA